jgi:tripartite-type tricarboxylate transporter receptor subunit TctC
MTKLLLCVLLMLSSLALAQPYPARPIRIVVPFAPGGGNDVLAREIANELAKRLGQPVLVENRPGAGGAIGADVVAKASADGYTLLMGNNSLAIQAATSKNIPYDGVNDFAGVAMVASISIALVVTPGVPARNVEEFVAYLKQNPGKLNYGSGGPGAIQHLAALVFESMTGTKMVHVPFKGAAQVIAEMMAGRVEVFFGAINTLLPPMRSGKLRALAVAGQKRSPSAPDVPTIAESGVPGYDVDIWLAILAPRRTPPEIIQRLNREINDSLSLPEVQRRISVHGMEVQLRSAEQLDALIRTDFERWRKLVRDTGLQVE